MRPGRSGRGGRGGARRARRRAGRGRAGRDPPPCPRRDPGRPGAAAPGLCRGAGKRLPLCAAGRAFGRNRRRRGDGLFPLHRQRPGPSPEGRARAFERFWRAEASRGRSLGGSGLGLPIVRAIARAHGGEALILPDSPGLTVEIRLPCRKVSLSEQDFDDQ
ncbi:ATP-binding protein [Rhodobacter capsulatus]|uniref:ATP-binding protein n=1 Tax=Rhodobacter capsulatus TaxID=1061 RepID=UPI0040279BF7